jgi:hypothetical protein
MYRLAAIVASLAGLTSAIAAPGTQREAFTTVQLMRGLVETQLVQFAIPPVESSTARDVYSVSLNFDGVLWLFTPGLGTRPLGLIPADRASVPATIKTRLARVAPLLERVEVLPNPTPSLIKPTDIGLHNGCFPSCLLQLIKLYAAGERIDEAGLVFLSGERVAAPEAEASLVDVGHCLLVRRDRNRWLLFDPARPQQEERIVGGPQVGGAPDPTLVAYAREANHVFNRIDYHRFSTAALEDLASNVGWRTGDLGVSNDTER